MGKNGIFASLIPQKTSNVCIVNFLSVKRETQAYNIIFNVRARNEIS
jgi:hypothetical protein